MKRILFATTALVASTSFAMADVDLSGSAEMGIIGGSDDFDTQFHTDIDVTFSMSGETDAGLTFGASIDLDESDTDRTVSVAVDEEEDQDVAIGGSPAFDNTTQGGETIFVSGALGTLTMGDTDGAFDFALEEAIIGSSLNDDHEHVGYNGNAGLDGTYDGQIARYDYSFGAFSVAASAEIDDDQDDNLAEFSDDFDIDQVDDILATQGAEIDNDTILGVGAKYSGEFGGMSFGVGLGYQRAGMDTVTVTETDDEGNATEVDVDGDAMEVLGISLDFAMDNGVRAIINYSDYDNVTQTFAAGDDGSVSGELDNHYGLAVGYEFGAFLVAANYGRFNLDDDGDATGYGLIANYDLGGGASLQAGYGRNEVDSDDVDFDDDDNDTFSFGIAMTF